MCVIIKKQCKPRTDGRRCTQCTLRSVFTGWYADKELTTKISDIKMIGNKTVYAGWKAAGMPDMLNGDDHFAYIVGYPDKTVHPQNGITRVAVATIFFRLLTDKVRDANSTLTNNYSDISRGIWYDHAVSTLSKMGIVKGDSHGRFGPNAPITCAEAMTLIDRVLNRLPESRDDLLNGMIQWSDNTDTSKWYYLVVQEAANSHYDDIKSDHHEKWTKLRDTCDWTQVEK